MGYQQGQHCYPTALAAANAAAAENNGRALVTGDPPRLSFLAVRDVTENQITYRVQSTPQPGVGIVYPVSYTAVPCQHIEPSDALNLAWMIVAVWAVGWGVRLAVQSFWRLS